MDSGSEPEENAEDFEQFRRSPSEKLDKILANTPESILAIIKDTMHGLLMKMGVPVAEANEYIELVEECRMGQLFENFEKVDIKVERKNTEEAKKRAEAAEKRAEEAEGRAEKAKNLAEVAEKRAEEVRSLAEAAEKRAEEERIRAEEATNRAIRSCISLCRELGGSKEMAVCKLMESFEVDKENAEKQVNWFW